MSSSLRKMDYLDTLKDPFGNLKVTKPFTLFDIRFVDGINQEKILFLEENSGTVTESLGLASAILTTAGTSGSKAGIQTKQYIAYQPGKGMEIQFTSVPFLAAGLGHTWRAGFYDDTVDKDTVTYPNQQAEGNGLFWEFDDTNGWAVVIRNQDADNRIAQANWNGDRLDGSGPSGLLIDETKGNIFWIDFEWLSLGNVRFGIFHKGVRYICHQEDHTNIGVGPYMQRASLPVRSEIINSTGGPSRQSRFICCSVISHGGYNPLGIVKSANTGITAQSIGTTPECIIAFRLQQPYNRRSIKLLHASALCSSAANALAEVFVNPTFTGSPTWTTVGGGSGVEYTTDQAVDITGLDPIDSSYMSNNNDYVDLRDLGDIFYSSEIDGTPDVIAVVITSTTANEDFYASVQWREII